MPRTELFGDLSSSVDFLPEKCPGFVCIGVHPALPRPNSETPWLRHWTRPSNSGSVQSRGRLDVNSVVVSAPVSSGDSRCDTGNDISETVLWVRRVRGESTHVASALINQGFTMKFSTVSDANMQTILAYLQTAPGEIRPFETFPCLYTGGRVGGEIFAKVKPLHGFWIE